MIILVLGGARAGKSSFALRLAEEHLADGPAAFIATAQALDDEMAQRIARHREERSPDWITIEEPYQLDEALVQTASASVVIVDCLTLFVSNWMMREPDESKCEVILREIAERFLSTAQTNTVICVSNEVGLGVVPGTSMGRGFRDLLGRVNQQFAEAASHVYLLVAGIPMRIKPSGTEL